MEKFIKKKVIDVFSNGSILIRLKNNLKVKNIKFLKKNKKLKK